VAFDEPAFREKAGFWAQAPTPTPPHPLHSLSRHTPEVEIEPPVCVWRGYGGVTVGRALRTAVEAGNRGNEARKGSERFQTA
jgi:hypothetical protein